MTAVASSATLCHVRQDAATARHGCHDGFRFDTDDPSRSRPGSGRSGRTRPQGPSPEQSPRSESSASCHRFSDALVLHCMEHRPDLSVSCRSRTRLLPLCGVRAECQGRHIAKHNAEEPKRSVFACRYWKSYGILTYEACALRFVALISCAEAPLCRIRRRLLPDEMMPIDRGEALST